jgi:hypothetical protein
MLSSCSKIAMEFLHMYVVVKLSPAKGTSKFYILQSRIYPDCEFYSYIRVEKTSSGIIFNRYDVFIYIFNSSWFQKAFLCNILFLQSAANITFGYIKCS